MSGWLAAGPEGSGGRTEAMNEAMGDFASATHRRLFSVKPSEPLYVLCEMATTSPSDAERQRVTRVRV